MGAAKNATIAFAAQILDIGARAPSPGDREQLRRLMLDCLGVSQIGATLEWTREMVDWAGRFKGTGAAPVVGTQLTMAPHLAALINGTAAHGYELDDTHDASMSHPGAVVIPAALAVAAETGASGDATLSAISCGYEAMARVGMAAHAARVIHKGFHPTALFGLFGSAAATAALMRFDSAALARAWGHALSLAGGSMQFSDEPRGTTVKRLHAGYAAHNGILAAEFAARGIEAPAHSLDGKYGFLALFGEEPDLAALKVPEGGTLQIHTISFKPYSCCRLFHSLIDGLRDVSDGFELKPDAIREINVRGPGVLAEQHMLSRPTSVMAAQYSLPFVVGASLAYGPYRYDSYREEKLSDPAILALADLVTCAPDAEIEAHYPAQMGSSVELVRANGTRRFAKVMNSRGTAANPLTTDVLFDKAAGLVSDITPRIDLGSARAALWKNGTDGRALARLFAA